MSTTIHAILHGIARSRTKLSIITPRKARQMLHEINTAAGSLWTTCSRLQAVVPIRSALEFLVHNLGTPQYLVPVVVPLRLARVICPPDGRNGTRRTVCHTIWILTRVRPLGWIQDDKRQTVSWARMVRVLLYSRRLFRNSVHCHLGGKCDILPQPVCISLTTIPRR